MLGPVLSGPSSAGGDIGWRGTGETGGTEGTVDIDKLSFYLSLCGSYSISQTLITERGGGEEGERGKRKRTKPH